MSVPDIENDGELRWVWRRAERPRGRCRVFGPASKPDKRKQREPAPATHGSVTRAGSFVFASIDFPEPVNTYSEGVRNDRLDV